MDVPIEILSAGACQEATRPVPRIVVVLNERIDAGKLLNVASHLALGFGASADESTRKALRLLDYRDAASGSHPNISALSLVVLKANPNQLRTLKARAQEVGLLCLDFLESMTGGSYLEQLERTAARRPEELDYWGVLLFGSRDQLDPLTRRFSLYRDASARPGN